MVACAAGLGPEREAEVLEGIHGSIDTGEHDDLVVAVSAGGGGIVPVEAAAAGMGVSAAAHVGVAEILGAVVEAVPAVDKNVGGAAAGGGDAVGGFEAHGDGEGVGSVAEGADAASDKHAGA